MYAAMWWLVLVSMKRMMLHINAKWVSTASVAALTATFTLYSVLYSTHLHCALVACSVMGLQ